MFGRQGLLAPRHVDDAGHMARFQSLNNDHLSKKKKNSGKSQPESRVPTAHREEPLKPSARKEEITRPMRGTKDARRGPCGLPAPMGRDFDPPKKSEAKGVHAQIRHISGIQMPFWSTRVV